MNRRTETKRSQVRFAHGIKFEWIGAVDGLAVSIAFCDI